MMRLIGLFLEPGAIRMPFCKLLIEQIMHALLCFLQLLIILAIPGIILLIFIPFIPAFPRNAVRIGTFPKVAEQPAALVAEFRVHDPNRVTHPACLLWFDSDKCTPIIESALVEDS